jgi:hypothetical protein
MPKSVHDWRMALIGSLLIGLVLAGINAWISVFYLEIDLHARLIWPSVDKPFIRYEGFSAVPLWGVHYFGDLQEGLSWAQHSSMG